MNFTTHTKISIKSFTLIELIIVIIIVGILASLGLTQYSSVVEKSRLVEAKIRIGVMRNLAYQYYLENGTLEGLREEDVDVEVVPNCVSTSFYSYYLLSNFPPVVSLAAGRCTSGGKTPNAAREYVYYLEFNPSTGSDTWHCFYMDGSSCFGLPG